MPNHSAQEPTAHNCVSSHGKAGWGITVALLRSQSRSPVAPGAPMWGTCSGPGSSVNANAILKRSAARLAEKAPSVMLNLELPEGLQGSKIPFKRFKANIL